MPWHLPEDLKYFKATTTGHTVIMGRKTWESLGKYAPLPNRRNIVVTQTMWKKVEGVEVSFDLGRLLEDFKKESNNQEIFIIGGGQIYKEAMPLADRLYLTRIHATIDGDTFFPDIPAGFKLVRSTPGQTSDPKLDFEVWERH